MDLIGEVDQPRAFEIGLQNQENIHHPTGKSQQILKTLLAKNNIVLLQSGPRKKPVRSRVKSLYL